MKIIIISATDFEVAAARQKIKSKKGVDISFVVTGIGMLATAVNLSKLVFQQQPDFIIQAGIAGSFDTNTKLGKTILVKEDYLGDLGVEEDGKWKDIFDLKLATPNTEPFKTKGLINRYMKQYNTIDLPVAKAVTVNQISTQIHHIHQLIKKYNPCLETMEGAALHYISNLYNIPYLQLRSVSNYVGERDKSKWKIKLAIDNLNKELQKLTAAVTKVMIAADAMPINHYVFK
jgi:futalosine hydrolase